MKSGKSHAFSDFVPEPTPPFPVFSTFAVHRFLLFQKLTSAAVGALCAKPDQTPEWERNHSRSFAKRVPGVEFAIRGGETTPGTLVLNGFPSIVVSELSSNALDRHHP